MTGGIRRTRKGRKRKDRRGSEENREKKREEIQGYKHTQQCIFSLRGCVNPASRLLLASSVSFTQPLGYNCAHRSTAKVLEDGVGVGEGVQGSAEEVGEPEGLQPVVVGRRGQAALRSHDTR